MQVNNEEASSTSELEGQIALARLLVDRLERLSADSLWAHRASGTRNALLRTLDHIDIDAGEDERRYLRLLIAWGFDLLEKAAAEIS